MRLAQDLGGKILLGDTRAFELDQCARCNVVRVRSGENPLYYFGGLSSVVEPVECATPRPDYGALIHQLRERVSKDYGDPLMSEAADALEGIR